MSRRQLYKHLVTSNDKVRETIKTFRKNPNKNRRRRR